MTINQLSWLVYLGGLLLLFGALLIGWRRSSRSCPSRDRLSWVGAAWSGLAFVTLGNAIGLLR